jgi:hypothetical protein
MHFYKHTHLWYPWLLHYIAYEMPQLSFVGNLIRVYEPHFFSA